MRTEQLVKALANDTLIEHSTVGRTAAIAYPLCLGLVAAAFFAILGPRANFSQVHVLFVTGMKLAITLTLAMTGLAAVLLLARPETDRRAVLLAAVPALALLGLALIFDLSTTGLAGWQSRMAGLHGWRCVSAVSAMSIPPLAATLFVLHQGAVTRHTLAGVVAGLAATGMGASFYALNCTDDSPLFMVVWYGAAASIVVALGILSARRFLRW